MKTPSHVDALAAALVLAVTATSEGDADRAVGLAQQIVNKFGLSRAQVAAAKRKASKILNSK